MTKEMVLEFDFIKMNLLTLGLFIFLLYGLMPESLNEVIFEGGKSDGGLNE
jgi:hypothetical protein